MASECSFDVVCKVDLDEVKNAVSQAMKEIGQRFDFKGSVSRIELKDEAQLVLTSDDEVRLRAVVDVLQGKLVSSHRRGEPAATDNEIESRARFEGAQALNPRCKSGKRALVYVGWLKACRVTLRTSVTHGFI